MKVEFIIYPVIALIFASVVGTYFGVFPKPSISAGVTPEDVPCERDQEEGLDWYAQDDSVNVAEAKSVPILVYHGIAMESPRTHDVLFCDFKEHMTFLKESGYQTISIQDFQQFTIGAKAVPDKSFLLTFDDGQKSSYYLTDALLEELGYSAVMFIITRHSVGEGSSYYLSRDEIDEMLETGRWEIQSHGKNAHQYEVIDEFGNLGHSLSNRIWLQTEDRLETYEEYRSRLRKDFVESKTEIERTFGVDVIAYAYPFGDFGEGSVNTPEARALIRSEIESVYELGNFYQVAPSGGFTYNHPGSSNPMIRRIQAPAGADPETFLASFENGRFKELPYTDNFSVDKGWLSTWAELAVDGSLKINSSSGSHGAAAFLNGSYLWRDYSFEARVESIKGRSVSLYGRYVDASNYVGCVFSNSDVAITQRIDGEAHTLARLRHDIVIDSRQIVLTLRVEGNSVVCEIDGEPIATTSALSPSLSTGGIGLKVYQPDSTDSHVVIGQITVVEVQ